MSRVTSLLVFIFLSVLFFTGNKASVFSFNLKIPFPGGEKWVVTQGYEGDGWIGSNPTHGMTNKDRYAIDFSLPGEQDYNKTVLAVADGIVHIKEQTVIDKITGKKNFIGYGQYIDIDHGDGIISRYAHLLSYSVIEGQEVEQGQEIGHVDNTGYKGGSHLHFAMYTKDSKGNYVAYKPEPMSGYTGFKAGEWYTSDNELYDPNEVKQEVKEEVVEEKGFWQKIKDTLGLSEDDTGSEAEQDLADSADKKEVDKKDEKLVEEVKNEGTYSLSYLNSGQEVEAEPGQVLRLEAQVKNTGTANWKKENISANVVGGLAMNGEYYHSSWLTKLRPAILASDAIAGQTSAFSFSLNTPLTPGDYVFKIQAVRIDDSFSSVPGGYWQVKIKVKEKIKEEKIQEVKGEKIEAEENLPVEGSLFGQTKEVIKETVEEVKKIVENIKQDVIQTFYGYSSTGSGGGGGGSSNPDGQTPAEDVVVPLPQIEITSHTSSTITNTNTTTIFGTKNEATEKVFVNDSLAVVVSSTAWQSEVSLAEGSNIFIVYGENSIGDKSASTTIEIVLDSVAPSAPSISAVQNSFASPTLYISWQGSGEEKFFDIEYLSAGVGSGYGSSDWLSLLPQTTSTDYTMPADKLNDYYFRVRAYDNLGNVSLWSEPAKITTDWPKSVVFSEIAWMGTGPTAGQRADEWIELYNNTDAEIDIADWKIFSFGSQLNFKTLNNTIVPAHSYFLLERTDDNAVLNVGADIIFTGELNNSVGVLQLVDNDGNIIDEVDCQGSWYAGSTANNQYRSMARVVSLSPGSWAGNWQTYEAVSPIAKPYGGSTFYGSPKYQNTGYWLLDSLTYNYPSFFIDNTLTLSTSNSPYVIDYLTEIPAGYKLQVEPGVILYGKDKTSYFKVFGELIMNGTVEKPIIITSALDVSYVDNNLSTLVGEAAPGDWSRIEIQPGGHLVASQTKFLFGGKKFFQPGGFVFGGKYMSQIIRNLGGVAELDSVEFNNNYLETDPDWDNYNAVVWTEAPTGFDATTTLANSHLLGGYYAVRNYRQENGQKINTVLNNNIFENFSAGDVIKSDHDFVQMSGNTFTNNVSNQVNFGAWNLEQDFSLDPGLEYFFSSINIPVGTTLTINPGVNIKMVGNIDVNGSLQALGTVDAPISISGDSRWGSIYFINSQSNLQNANIFYGNLSSDRDGGMVKAIGSNLTFDNVNFTNARRPYNMIYLENSNTVISNSGISWPSVKNINSTINGIKMKGGSLLLNGVNFNEMDIGVEVLDGGTVEMQNMDANNFQNIHNYNWWPINAWAFATST